MTSERRKAPRVAERVTLAITDGGAAVRTETKNLSASGAYCTLERFLPPMTKLQLEFELSDGQRRTTVRCTGVIVRVEPIVANSERGGFNTAIFFTELADRDRAAIERFVRRRLSTAPSAD